MADERRRRLERLAKQGDADATRQLLAMRSRDVRAYERLMSRWEELPTPGETLGRIRHRARVATDEQRRRLAESFSTQLGREHLRRDAVMILEEARSGEWVETEARARRMVGNRRACADCYGVGTVNVRLPEESTTGYPRIERQPCPSCAGQGRVEAPDAWEAFGREALAILAEIGLDPEAQAE